MPTRRSFLRTLAGLAAAAGLSRFAGGAALPARKGIPGRTYFRALEHELPDGMALYLNGEDVTWWTNESDLVAGWVKGYEHYVTPDGRRMLGYADAPWRHTRTDGSTFVTPNRPEEIHRFGKVELRPKGDGLTFTRTAIVTGLDRIPQSAEKFTGVLRVRANASEFRNGKWQPVPWRLMRYERGRLVEVSPELPEAV
jgi:hypothetical protein